jgi:protein SFI1
MWAPRDSSAGTSRASSPRREETREVADTRTDLLGCVDATVFSEAHRGLRREDENAEDWRVGGFDVFERRTSPLRRKRAPLVPGEFDHDELVRRALERARVDVKAVGSAHLATEITPRIPLKALVPGNAGLHRGVAEHRASVRERSISRGLSFDDVKINSAVTVSATVSATTEAYEPETTRTPTAERLDEHHSPSVASSAWSAESNASRVELLAKASSSSSRNVTGVRLFGDSSSVYYPNEGGEHTTDTYPSEETLLRQREEEQRRLQQNARRRHRKRLATIVVAQWRWFARDALENLPSKMHFVWRLKRETFAVWRGVAGEAASLAALRLVAAERERRLRNTVRAFEERKERRVSERTREEASRRFVAATAAAAAVRFFRWRSFVRRKSMKRAREKELSALAEARAASSRIAKKRALLRRWFHVARKKKTKRDAETRIVNASNAFFDATKRRAAFLEWRRAFRDETRKRALFIARLDRDRAFRNGLQTFLAWRDERARPKTLRRELKIRARDFFQTTFVRKTWTAWRFDALSFLKQERLDKRHVWDVLDALVQSARWRLGVAAAHFAAKTDMRRKSILKLWRDVARDSANEAAAETYARTVVRKRILRAVFSHAFANPSRDAFFARRADAHLMRRRAAASLRAWRFTTERERVREVTKKRASSFRAVRLVAKTFGAWCGPFLSRARSKRLESRKLLKAVATRDALVKCRAFIGWSYRSKVVGRGKRRIFNDAVRFQRAFLTTRAFTGWVSFTEAERASDALSDAKLATATAALQATFVGRVFDAWLENVKTKIARRLVSALATRRFVKTVTRRALLGWKARCEQKKASRERLVVAMDHYDRKRLTFTALEAWVVFLVRRRLKGANASKAEAHHARQTLGVRFAAWIAYVEARRAKRLAIRDALDAHTMDAIKHACASWLREGLRRREERRERSLESVADDAAREDGGDLARRVSVRRKMAIRRQKTRQKIFRGRRRPVASRRESKRVR